MKIRVVHEDGAIETLTLTGAWECHEGRTLNRLVQGGFDHFFTKDGSYEGWGSSLAPDTSLESAKEMAEAMSAKRVIQRED